MANPFAAIHIAKKEAGINDAQYRDILFRTFQVRSSKDLDPDQMREVIRVINNGGKIVEKKPPKDFSHLFPKPTIKPREWFFFTPTEAQWKNQGKEFDNYDKQGKVLVVLWNADGSKQFKWRYK